jgi:eukaryotic-like serine/threonine-protein kinase
MPVATIDELMSRWEEMRASGYEASVEALCRDQPELIATLSRAIARRRAALEGAATADLGETRPGAPGEASDAGYEIDVECLTDGLAPPQGPGEVGRLGPFAVVRLLGAGGMGAVFEAVDLQLGRSVALKVMRSRNSGSGTARRRFLREARAAAALEHDHVVPIYQVGEDRGIPYLAMPLLRGRTLADRLRRGPRPSAEEVLRVGREVAEGLAAAHDLGLVHRDVKPANIWLEEGSGRVKILDFGLARTAHEEARLTREGTILGTPAFMAPEQAVGGRDIDHRCDLYSLGAVLYRMVAGRPPFAGRSEAEILTALVQDDPTPPRRLDPDVPEGLDGLILRLLAKDPAARPPTARAVVEEIRALERPAEAAATAIEIDIRLDAPEALELRPRPRPDDLGRRWLPVVIVAALLVGALAAGVALLPSLHDAAGGEGRLVIESPSPAVVVTVVLDGRTVGVLDPSARPSLRLHAGSYALELADATGQLALATDRVTLRPGERKVVRVMPSPEATAPRPAIPSA